MDKLKLKDGMQSVDRVIQRLRTTSSEHEDPRLEEAVEELSVCIEELRVSEEELHERDSRIADTTRHLQLEHQRYRDLFEFSPEGYIVMNLASVIEEANAIAAKVYFGAPVVVVDFGTAVTFDVVNSKGDYAGGIIAPGLAAMTDYLHEKTALLPRIKISEPKNVIGKSTEEAMLAGAVHGYRGLIRGLLAELKKELRVKQLPVVATGGYAKLMAAKLPEISAVEPDLTLEGLRLTWLAQGH